MEVRIKPHNSSPERMFVHIDGKTDHAGSFKDCPGGTVYTSKKAPKGEFVIIGINAFNQKLVDRKTLPKFVQLVESQRIPNVPFRIDFKPHHLTEEGFNEFLTILFPKRKAKKKVTRRYYLHAQIKKCKCVRMGATDKTIYVSMNWPTASALRSLAL